MLDFNTKREILRNLRSKRNKNKLLWLPCVIAELFVKLWYAVVCSIDMALSDKNGNFLGLKMRKSAKAKSRKKDDIVHVKKPFLGRVLSAVLAFSFVFMMVPELGIMDLSVFAALDLTAQGYTNVVGNDGFYYLTTEYNAAKNIAIPQFNKVVFADQSAYISWSHPNNASGPNSYTYQVGYLCEGETQYVENAWAKTNYTFGTKDENMLLDSKEYEFFVTPRIKLDTYTIKKDENNEYVKDDSGDYILEKNGTQIVSGTPKVTEANTPSASITKVDLVDIKYDGKAVVLTWNHDAYNTMDGELPYGYVVFRRTIDYSGNNPNPYKMVGKPFSAASHKDNDTGLITYSDTTISMGNIYEYYVRAYTDMFGGSDYVEKQPGIVDSGDDTEYPETLTIPLPPARVPSMEVTSNEKDTLTVTWKKPNNSNVDGYYLFRSEEEFTIDYVKSITIKDADGNDVLDSEGKVQYKYWDKETETFNYYAFLVDMELGGKAKSLVPNEPLKYDDKYKKDNQLKNDVTYYYYLIPYVDADTEYKKLYGPMTYKPGCINAALQPPQLDVPVTEDGKVTLKWKEVPNADGYTIYIFKEKNYNNSNKGLGSLGTIDVGKVTTYTFDGLLNGDTYTYQVQAYTNVETSASDNLKSPWSNPRTITVGETLGIPQDVKVTTKDGQNTITWSGVDGAEGYYLYYRCNGGSLKHFDLTKESFTHTGLQNGDFYEYYVVAYKVIDKSYDPNQGGKEQIVKSEPSVTVTIVVGDTLDAPKDFAVTTEDGVAHLSWTKVNGAEGYIIEASGSGHGVKEIDVSKEKYDHIDLENGDSWTYRVRAYKTVNGKRDYSVYTRSITVVIGISLNAPLDLTATAGNRQIDLSWTAVKGAEGYIVYLYDDFTMEYEPLTVTSKTTYSHVGLKNGKGYTYMVAAFKTSNGERHIGEYSMAVTAIPTTGSITDIDHTLNIKGTTPYGISHSEYISAKTNHDAFSESVDVYITTNQESTKAVKDVLKHYANGLSSFIIYPFDISVYKENTLIKVDPEDGYTVTMTIPIPDKLIAYRDYLTVVHINENLVENIEETEWYEIQDQRLEVLPCAILEIDNVWCVQFVCSNFSPYAFVIYKEHINDVSSGGGVMDGSFAGTFNSGMLLLTSLPDILPNNKKLTVVESKKRYRIKKVTRK